MDVSLIGQLMSYEACHAPPLKIRDDQQHLGWLIEMVGEHHLRSAIMPADDDCVLQSSRGHMAPLTLQLQSACDLASDVAESGPSPVN